VIGRRVEPGRRQARRRVSALGAPEEQDVRLWFMDLVVHPPPRLLHSQRSPFWLAEQLPLRLYLLEDLLGQHHVPVLVVGIDVFLGVFDLAWIMGHQLLIKSKCTDINCMFAGMQQKFKSSHLVVDVDIY
jgi:hypothetical protein